MNTEKGCYLFSFWNYWKYDLIGYLNTESRSDQSVDQNCWNFQSYERQPHKMVKHTQTIRRQIADECFEYIWQFYGLGAYRVN